MICPYYKNKDVFNGFNEMIEALKGRPMTEEEFRSPELRNQRSGQDYRAMEAAYRIYNRNGGNLLDMTPQGKPSVLFQTLLDHFGGDRTKALIAKSNVYSDQFFNWFGDWTSEEKENVSKAVDENGEPMVLWHGTSEIFNKFEYDENGTRGAHKVHDRHSFFFTNTEQKALKYRHSIAMACYLDMKNPAETSVKDGKFDTIEAYTNHENDLIRDPQYDSVIIERYDKEGDRNGMEPTKQWVVKKPNQIKSIANLGEFNPNTDNIYYSIRQNIDVDDANIIRSTNITDSFGQQLTAKLLNGETVSSRDLMSAMLSNGIFHKTNTDLANVLSKHDIPVRLGYSMSVGELAETITDGGGSVILINPNELQQISRGYFGTTMMHEIIHAVTVDIINHPKTAEDRAFVEQNRKVFNRMSSLFRKDGAIKFDVLSGMHCLDNEKEFAAYFASDPAIRHAIFDMADAIDRTRHMGLFERLKRLVNKLSIAIANKAIFKATDSEQVKIYQKTVEDYLYNRPSIKRGNIPSKSYLKAVYEEQDLGVQNHERFLDSMKRLEQMRDAERNFVMLGTERFNVTVGQKHKPGSVQITSWDRVKDALATRIDALRASNLDSVTKSRFLQITQNQLEMFAVDEAGKYYAIQNLLDTAIPQIIKDIDNLRTIRKESGTFTNGDYMYQMHANLGMYNSVFNSIKKMLDDDENRADMVAAFNAKATREQDKITIEDLQEVERHLDNAINFTQEGINIVEYMLKENVIHKLKTIANEVGNPEMDSYINALNSDIAADAIDDIGTLSSWAGSADSSSNEAVRTIAYIINKAMTSATLNSAGKATDLLRLKENLKKGEKEWHLYETDENGNFTGYLVRDLNFGRFYKNYEKAIEKINKDIRDIFDLPDLQLNSKVALEINKTAIVDGVKITPKEYFDRKKEEWLQQNAERRYKSRYYEYYSKLPQRVKDSMSEIRVQINSILNNYENLYDENGYPHYEKLSQQDWEKLNSLWEQRRALRSERDEYGNLKKGQDLEDAKALKELYEKLYKYDENGNERQKKLDIAGWSRARQAIIDKYGLNSKELDEWDERNTRKHLKKNSYGEALVFKKIEEEFGGTKPQYGEEYERLGAEKQEILNNYKLASGEVDINTLPDVIKNIIIKIDNKRSEIRKSARQNNKTFAEQAAKYKEISDKYIKYTETRQFKKVLEEIRKEAERRAAEQDDADALDAFSVEDFMYSMLQETYGYYYGGSDDLFGFDPGEFVPYSWLTQIEALDPQYMEYEPNDAWIDKAENDLSNPNFDESYGTQWVPKRSLYDNSEQYERIFGKNGVGGSETLRALYEGVQQTIVESNQMYNRQYADNFLLPQKECTFLGRLRRKPFWSGIWNYIKTLGGMIGTIDPDISTVAAGRLIGTYDDPNDIEKGSNLQETTDGRYREVGGTYPDGRSFHIIPQYFTRRMKNPQYISRDLVDITASYYKMAQLYKQKADVRDDCEAILDMLKMQQFKTPDYNSVVKTIRRIGGLNNDESNTYQYTKRLIERDLYDIQRTPFSITLGDKTWDISRILSLWKRWTTARNLGMNPKVAFVGFLTTSFTHVLNGLVGYKYGRKEMWRANNIVLKEFGRSLFTDGTFLGSRLTKNRVMLILEMMDMSNQLDRKTEHSNRNRWLQVIYKNSTYGLMSAADISSKAVIAISTMLSYRLVDGEFMTRHMIEESKEQYGDRYQEMLDKFDKSQTTCYDIFIDGDEKLQIDPQYQAAWDKVKHTVVNKSIKNAEQADGMATRLQKAMMTRNFVGAFALIHRQYIPLMIQQTWGARVYDYDAQEYKNHQFRTLFKYVNRLCASNALAAFGGGCFVGTAFGGFGIVPLIGGTGALTYSLYKKYVKGSQRKSFKEAIRDEEFFNAGGSTKIRANSVANKYQVKQTILEVALINCFIAPLANFMVAAADGWDKDDKLTYIILQWLAYTARAFQFEANTKYNLLDLSNNIQSLTAGTSVTEGLADVITGTGVNLFFSSLHGKQQAGSIVYDIYDVYQQEKNSEPDDNVIKNSKSYKGWKRWQRNIFKLTPFHNWWEQTHDPEAKRRYQENKIMRMSDEDKRSWIYEAYQTLKDGGTIFDLF